MDQEKAHQFFSTHCFNGVWELLEKPDRNASDDEMMREMAHASLFHWLKREDCQDQNRSVGYWQLSRVYAVLCKAEAARVYGERCLGVSEDLSPFFLGYAYEALARAAKVANDSKRLDELLAKARKHCENVEDEEGRKLLEADLDDIAK